MERVFEQRPEGAATMASSIVDAHNYYEWVLGEMLAGMGSRILDVGSGYGTHLIPLLKRSEHVMAIDLSDVFVARLKERFGAEPNFETDVFDFGKDDINSLIEKRFDTITCLNVLEHIQDDVQALSLMRSILAPTRGHVLLQVPAHEWLYGAFDEMAGHYRRYTTSQMRGVLEAAGFEVVKLRYLNAFGVLPWYINTCLRRPKTIEDSTVNAQIKIFDRYVIPIVSRIESVARFPFGQSVIAIGRAKPL
jgi:SAM-dependent methyltransferase